MAEFRQRLALSITVDVAAGKKHEETLGKSAVFTNQDDWSLEDVVWAFREKYMVEMAFKRMK